MLHDVGRVGMPDDLLVKLGPADRRGVGLRARSPEVGARMVGTTDFDDIGDWILAHHERPDGRGYPAGLLRRRGPARGAHPRGGRRLRGDDADRPTARRWSPDAPRWSCAGGRARQFDERVVEAFLRAV